MRPTRAAGKILKFYHSARRIWGTQHPQTPDCGGDHHDDYNYFGNHCPSIHQLRCDRDPPRMDQSFHRRTRLARTPFSHFETELFSGVPGRPTSQADGQLRTALITMAAKISTPLAQRFRSPRLWAQKEASSGPHALRLCSQTKFDASMPGRSDIHLQSGASARTQAAGFPCYRLPLNSIRTTVHWQSVRW